MVIDKQHLGYVLRQQEAAEALRIACDRLLAAGNDQNRDPQVLEKAFQAYRDVIDVVTDLNQKLAVLRLDAE